MGLYPITLVAETRLGQQGEPDNRSWRWMLLRPEVDWLRRGAPMFLFKRCCRPLNEKQWRSRLTAKQPIFFGSEIQLTERIPPIALWSNIPASINTTSKNGITIHLQLRKLDLLVHSLLHERLVRWQLWFNNHFLHVWKRRLSRRGKINGC